MTAESEWKIVLIDDEQDIREVMAITLEDAGYQVHTAPHGKAGLHLCQTIKPQIVITDIRMPGMNGIRVLESAKTLNPEIEVIVCSAFGDMGMAIHALQLDASDFVTKPVNEEALRMALNRAKDRYTARKQLKDYTTLLEAENARTVEELKKTFSFQKNLLESAMDGIIGCDENDNVIFVNNVMAQMLGHKKQTVVNEITFSQLFRQGEANRLKEALFGNKYGGDNRLFLFETTLKSAERDIPVQISASVLFHEGQKTGLVCYLRDLREIHRLEREFADQARILHQDKMMSLGRLAASVVHEINNPLTGILNYARLMTRILNRGGLTPEKQKDFQQYLALVESETDRCSQIVSNLLSFSRKTPLTFESISISDLIQKCCLLSKHKLELQKIAFVTDVAPHMPPVKGDFNQLQQCLINLIFNAIDAMPDGGELTLTGGYNSALSQATIVVEDTGKGIPEADLPYIFEPFYTTKEEGYGVGLGLSTVYGILEHHKGNIEVKSQEGKGSVFTITLPLCSLKP